jgi:hypothetical protein
LNKSEQRRVLTEVAAPSSGAVLQTGGGMLNNAVPPASVISAIVYRDASYLADAIDHMRTQGKAVPAELSAQHRHGRESRSAYNYGRMETAAVA